MTTETFKWTEEVEKNANLRWDRCSQALYVDGIWVIRHERDVPESFPAPLAQKCREIIQANRELEEDETRLIGSGRIVKMSVKGDYLCLNGLPYSEETLRREQQHKPERLAYLLKHRELQPNQVRFDDGEVVEMRMDGKRLRIGGFYAPRDLWSDCPDPWTWNAFDKSITDPTQRQRVRDFYERERRVEDVVREFDARLGLIFTTPDKFNGRRVKVTFEDLGPDGGAS